MTLTPPVFLRLYTFLLCAIVAVLPFSIALTGAFTILLVLTWLLEGQWKTKWTLAATNNWVPFFLLLYVLHILALLYTENMKAGLFDLEKKLSLLLFPLVFGTSLVAPKVSRKRVLYVFVASCLAVAVYCLAGAFYRYWHQVPPATSVYGGFEATQAFKSGHGSTSALWEYITYSELTSPLKLHPTYLSMYVVLITLFLLQNLLKIFRPSVRPASWWLQLLLFGFFTVFLFLLSSRIMLLVYVALISFLGFVRLSKAVSIPKLVLGLSIGVILLGMVAASVPVVRHRFVSDLEMLGQNASQAPGTGMYSRLLYWQAATHTMLQYPVFGTGTGDAQAAFDAFYTAHNMTDAFGKNAHNQYLQTGAMLGTPAMLYLLLLVLLPLALAWRRGDLLYTCFLLLVGAAFLTESALQTNKGIVFYALFNMLFFFSKTEEEQHQVTPTSL